MVRQPHGEPAAPAAGAADTRFAVENSNELNGGPQKVRLWYRPARTPGTHAGFLLASAGPVLLLIKYAPGADWGAGVPCQRICHGAHLCGSHSSSAMFAPPWQRASVSICMRAYGDDVYAGRAPQQLCNQCAAAAAAAAADAPAAARRAALGRPRRCVIFCMVQRCACPVDAAADGDHAPASSLASSSMSHARFRRLPPSCCRKSMFKPICQSLWSRSIQTTTVPAVEANLFRCPVEDAAVAATAAELEEALQEVSRRGARIDALTCEVAWYRCACCRGAKPTASICWLHSSGLLRRFT